MKDRDSLSAAVNLGVDYLGFVVDFPKSPRSMNANEFLRKVEWLRKLHKGSYKVVAVTVDMQLEDLEYIIESGLPDIIQLHGNEPVAICAQVRNRIETWKAVNANKNMSDYQITSLGKSADKVLLDTGSATEKAKNRSGAFTNTTLYNTFAAHGIDVVLSGGLEADNIQKYLQAINPAVIDVSRGIESAPGVKSKKKMQDFMEAVNHFYTPPRNG